MAAALRGLGFVLAGRGRLRGTMKRVPPPTSHEQRARLLAKLRDMGLAFSAGKDWSPIEVARHYREQGLLDGPLRKVYWLGPNDWQVEEV